MHLEHIRLINFKNYEDFEVDLSSELNCFTGDNGSGKTNILDAIHYLSLSKSAFSSQDTMTIRHNADFFSVLGRFVTQKDQHNVLCSLKKGDKKVLKIDKKAYERISDHIGKFPLVLIAPDDTDLIREGSETRRKFFDGVLSQTNHEYLEKLMRYNHLLRQRNSFLKMAFERNKLDKTLLESFDEQLIPLNFYIANARQEFIKKYVPIFKSVYKEVSGGKEETQITYESQVEDKGFEKLFKDAVQADYVAQRTSLGIHRDDYAFTIDGYPLKRYGSQGQQKSFVIALKLAQFEIMRGLKESKPILLLDDIFDKLDDQRIHCLLDMVADDRFGQIFITDARKERTNHFLSVLKKNKKDVKIRIFEITKGKLPDGQKI